MKRVLYILPLLILIAVGGLSLTKLGSVTQNDKSDLFVGKDRPAPDLDLAILDSTERYTLGGATDEPQIVNLWATWCVPCRVEHPLLMQMSENVPIAGIAYKDTPNKIVQMLEEDGNPFQVVALDTDGMAGLALGVNAVPETFLVDAQGMIVRQHRGPLTKNEMNAFLEHYSKLKSSKD